MIYPIQLISMALFATDGDNVIDAWDAKRERSYACIECKASLKLRRRKNQFPHFYHLKKSPSCRLYSKSERHLLIQLHIQKRLPLNESQIEKPFPSIHRIADLAWEKEKIVFEIQCSPISPKEAEARVLEYESLGYVVIWILDDRLFNQKQLRPAEAFMRRGQSYFVTGKDSFILYDQLELFHKNKRIKKGERRTIDLTKKGTIPRREISAAAIPSQMKERFSHSKHYFGNDLTEKTIYATSLFTKILELWLKAETEILKTTNITTYFKEIFERYVRDPYLAILNLLLKN